MTILTGFLTSSDWNFHVKVKAERLLIETERLWDAGRGQTHLCSSPDAVQSSEEPFMKMREYEEIQYKRAISKAAVWSWRVFFMSKRRVSPVCHSRLFQRTERQNAKEQLEESRLYCFWKIPRRWEARRADGFLQYQQTHLGNGTAFILIKALFISAGSGAIMTAFENRQSKLNYSTQSALVHKRWRSAPARRAFLAERDPLL